MSEKASRILDEDAISALASFRDDLSASDDWDEEHLHSLAKAHAEEKSIKMGAIAQPLRAALTGSNVSPGIFEVMAVLGRGESLARIEDALQRP